MWFWLFLIASIGIVGCDAWNNNEDFKEKLKNLKE